MGVFFLGGGGVGIQFFSGSAGCRQFLPLVFSTGRVPSKQFHARLVVSVGNVSFSGSLFLRGVSLFAEPCGVSHSKCRAFFIRLVSR